MKWNGSNDELLIAREKLFEMLYNFRIIKNYWVGHHETVPTMEFWDGTTIEIDI